MWKWYGFPSVPETTKYREWSWTKRYRQIGTIEWAQLDRSCGWGVAAESEFPQSAGIVWQVPISSLTATSQQTQETLGLIIEAQPACRDSFLVISSYAEADNFQRFLKMLGSTATYWVYLLVVFSAQTFVKPPKFEIQGLEWKPRKASPSQDPSTVWAQWWAAPGYTPSKLTYSKLCELDFLAQMATLHGRSTANSKTVISTKHSCRSCLS